MILLAIGVFLLARIGVETARAIPRRERRLLSVVFCLVVVVTLVAL